MTATRPPRFDVVIIAGGRGSRLGGVDKAGLELDGSTLLDRALTAVPEAERVCVVAPRRAAGRPVIWALEEPRGGGPSAALGAGIRSLSIGAADLTAVLSVDLVHPGEALGALRRESIPDAADGVIAVDESGRRQPLLAVYRTEALAEACSRTLDGVSLRALLDGLDLNEVSMPDWICADVDTPADVRRLGITFPAEAEAAAAGA